MRLPLHLWTRTLATLGLVVAPPPAKKPRAPSRHRPLRVEQLEPLTMLATGVAVFADQASYVEGETAHFTFQLSQPAPQPFAIEYEITGGPAGPQSVVLHFSQGTTSATVPVETADNLAADDGYALNIVVKSSTEVAPPGGGGTFGAATTDILDDDTGDGSGGAWSADDNDDFFASSFGSSSGGGGGSPQSVMLDAPSGEASEGIPFQLTGTISPPGYYSFSYTIDYNYGNFNYNPGTGAFSVYVLIPDDEPSGPPELPEFDDIIKLTMKVYAIGQQDPAASHSVDVKVNNMAPTFTHPEYGDLLLIDIYDYPLGGPYFVVNGNIHDYGTQDEHTVTINWGDGTSLETFPLEGSIFSTHRYAPDGGDYLITVTVEDDDDGIRSIQGLAPMYLLDLDNDADNNGEIDEDDDPIEHVPPGAYIGVNGDDDDEDGIPDMSSLQSVPVENENDLEPMLIAWEPTVRIYEDYVLDYTGWHVVLTLDPPPVWDSYEEEVISVARLYTASDKSGYVPFVETGPYDMLALAWPAEDAFSTTFYVEALSAGQFSFQLELREPGWGVLDEDPVVFTALVNSVNLTIYNGQFATAPVPEDDELTVGAFTVANMNDTDGDGTEDREDNAVLAHTDIVNGQPKFRGVDEVDLMRLVISRPANYVPGTGVELLIRGAGEEDVRFWALPTKEIPIAIDPNGFSAMVGFADGQMERTIWVELTWYSNFLRSLQIEARYRGASDKVAMTGIWAKKVAHNSDGTNGTALVSTEPWSNLPANSTIRSALKTLFGSTGPIDLYRNSAVENVIVQAWKVEPADILTVDQVKFDITRRKNQMTRGFIGTLFVDSNVIPYPDLWDEANDEGPDEEDEEGPYNGFFFVIDGPGTSSLPVPGAGKRRFYGDNFE